MREALVVVSLYSCHWMSSSSLISGLIGTAAGMGAATGGVACRVEAAGRAPGGARGRF